MSAAEEEKGRDPPVQTAAASRTRPRPPVGSMAQAPPSYDDVERIDTPVNVGVPRPSIERAHREMVSDIDAQLEAEQPRAPINYGQMDPADVATSLVREVNAKLGEMRMEFRDMIHGLSAAIDNTIAHVDTTGSAEIVSIEVKLETVESKFESVTAETRITAVMSLMLTATLFLLINVY